MFGVIKRYDRYDRYGVCWSVGTEDECQYLRSVGNDDSFLPYDSIECHDLKIRFYRMSGSKETISMKYQDRETILTEYQDLKKMSVSSISWGFIHYQICSRDGERRFRSSYRWTSPPTGGQEFRSSAHPIDKPSYRRAVI
jgi:hypothetical protein